MHYLAFDVSKETLDVVFTNLRGMFEYSRIQNDEPSILAWIERQSFPKKLLVGAESTGDYHLALERTFVKRGYSFRLINPILTKQFTRSTIRKKKTDQSDSLIIAKLLAQGEGRDIREAELNIEAKTEQRILGKFVDERKRLKFMEKHLLVSGGSSLGKEAIQTMLESVTKQTDQFECSLKKKYGDQPDIEIISSIPGIGWKLAFIIWSEIGDIHRFKSAKELVAFCGLDPRIRQSGTTLNSTGKVTKRGSTRLRYAFFIGANISRMFDPEMKTYYEKKKAEGKKHTVATCSTARKLIHRVFAVWKRGTAYVAKEEGGKGENAKEKKGVDER